MDERTGNGWQGGVVDGGHAREMAEARAIGGRGVLEQEDGGDEGASVGSQGVLAKAARRSEERRVGKECRN